MSKTVHYLLTKLSGAGLAMAIFALYLLSVSGFDMYDFSEGISNPLWFIFYGYGIACSLLIDFIAGRFRTAGHMWKIVFYIAAGYAFFLVRHFDAVSVIMGTFGAFSALVFYAGTTVSARSRPFTYGFAIAVPLALLLIVNIDFTVKKGWEETKSQTSYEARFDYFNGKHEIPIHAEKGQTITFSITFDNANGGGWGYRVLSEGRRPVGMSEEGDDRRSLRAEETGIYRIVVTGDNVAGSFAVNWRVTD